MIDRCLSALIETDRRYFESGAVNDDLGGAIVSWVPGSTHLAAGCVVHRVPNELDGDASVDWVGTVEQRVADLGATTCRIYWPRRDGPLATALGRAGFSDRTEVAWAVAIDALAAPRPDVALHLVASDDRQGWQRIRAVHREGGVGSGVHAADPDEWTDLMHRRCTEGELRAHLVEVGGRPCGTVGTLQADGLLRSKNILVASDLRRLGIGISVISRLAQWSESGNRTIGAFAVPRTDGAGLYPAARMRPIGEQIEWSKPLGGQR